MKPKSMNDILAAVKMLFRQSKSLDAPKVNKLFDELWRELNHSGAGKISGILNTINNWTELNVPDSRFHALAKFTLGYACFFSGDYRHSLMHCQEATNLFVRINDEDGIAICNIVLGNSYRSMGANDLAIQCYLRAQQHDHGLYPIVGLGFSYQLAEVYIELGKCREALPLLDQALQLVKHHSFAPWWQPRIINSKANALVRVGEVKKGLAAFRLAHKISNKLDFQQVAARILTDMAAFFRVAGDFKKAVKYNEEALSIRHSLNLQNAGISNMLNLADIHSILGNYKDALDYLQEAMPLAESLGMKSKLARIYELLALVAEKTSEPELSLRYYKIFHQTTTEVSQEEIERKIENYKEVIEAEQTHRENILIKEQKTEIEQKNAELQMTVTELVLAKGALQTEKQRSDTLLLNILPAEVAEELKEWGSSKARLYKDVTVLFTDFKGFTTIAEKLSPTELVKELHICFSAFDSIMERYHIEKIKTVGDAYLAVCGMPIGNPFHARDAVNAALEIRDFIKQRKCKMGSRSFEVRIGLHSGSVVAGIVGIKKFAYDIWGDTVNTAARMEQSSEPGQINISPATYELVKDEFRCLSRGKVHAKNKGDMEMYFIEGVKA